MSFVSRKTLVEALPIGAVFLGSFAFLLSGIHVEKGNDRPSFFMDEAHKIGESYFGRLFFGRLDVTNPLWKGDFYAKTNPPVPKYLFWAGLALSGRSVSDLGLQDEFEKNWRRRNVLRESVPDDMLRATRRVSALFGALSAACLFGAGRRLGGILAGLVAVVLFLGHPDVAYHARVGLPDSMLWFFVALSLPVSWRAFDAYRRRLSRGDAPEGPAGALASFGAVALVPGLVTALATGTKLNGALAGVTFAGTMAVAAWAARREFPTAGWRRWGSAVAAVLAAAALSIVLFVAFNPSYYGEPFGRVRETLRLYADWTVKQQVEPGGGLLSLGERVAVVGVFTLRSARSPLSALLGPPGAWLGALGALAGVLFLAGRARPLLGGPRDPQERDSASGAATALVWTAVCLVGTTLWLPLAWIRYLLLPYLAFCLLAGIGLAAGLPALLRSVPALLGRRGSGEPDRARSGRRSRQRPSADAAGEARPSRSLSYAALSLTLAGWALLSFTPWVVRPELVPPGTGVEPDRDVGGLPYLPGPSASDGGSAAACQNAGQSLVLAGRSAEALPWLDRALALASRGDDGALGTKVRMSRILFDLARARGDVGDREGAVAAVRQHRESVLAVRDAMVSGDPKIRAEYDGLLAKDDRVIGRLEGSRPQS